MGKDITSTVSDFFNNARMDEGWNDTLIALILKVKWPEKVNQFQPISLCNVCYKIITKVITNKLKGLFSKIIGEEQSNFVPGRQIIDNIAIDTHCFCRIDRCDVDDRVGIKIPGMSFSKDENLYMLICG